MSSGAGKCTPYTENEKLLLASLVDKHKIVESKRTDASTTQKKQAEWEAIAKEYNAQDCLINTARTAAQLKKLWANLKQRKRKINTEVKHNRLLTGGGPEPDYHPDPVMEAVDVSSPLADVSLPCPWDTTAIFEKNTADNSFNEEEQESCEILVLEVDPADKTPTASPIPSGFTKSKRSASSKENRAPRIPMSLINSEGNIRIQKLQEALKQQQELHDLKIKIEKEQLQTAIASRKKAEAEKELSELKLLKFRNENSL